VYTVRNLAALSLLALGASAVSAQPVFTPDWRRIGNTAIQANLVAPAGGPVSRVWYSQDGSTLFARTMSGHVLSTTDFESWKRSEVAVPALEPGHETDKVPELGAKVRVSKAPGSSVWYALGKSVYSSTDNGHSWQNLSRFKGRSMIGEGLMDLALSPKDPDEITVGGRFGVWRSLDGGLTWSGLNDSLANLPVRRLSRVPSAGSAVGVVLAMGGSELEAEWTSGQDKGWVIKEESSYTVRDSQLRASTSNFLESDISAAVRSGSAMYAGASDGRVWGSTDEGLTWTLPYRPLDSGAVLSISVVSEEPRLAFATLAPGNAETSPRLIRTINAGLTWGDLTGNLPAGPVKAVAADLTSGAIYAATASGLYVAYADLHTYGAPPQWSRVGGLPEGAVADVQLDAAANQVFVAMDSDGVFAAMAPHRFRQPKLVNGADYSARPAAPGSLLSFVGSGVTDARVGNLAAPILNSTSAESQLQVPFEVSGSSLTLALLTSSESSAPKNFTWPLAASSPAIFTYRDGAAVISDADLGLPVEAKSPARGGSRIQVLATGLGKVIPAWRTGLAAPVKDPPKVEAPVNAYLDQYPVKVTKATLAPGFVGLYLVEIQLPDVVNSGPAQLVLESGGLRSESITVHLRAY
jgi:uncharacterized protein (TIGR03437 family)